MTRSVPITWRPLDGWPGTLTPDRERKYSQFKRRGDIHSWERTDIPLGETLDLLDRELYALDAELSGVPTVIQLALPASAFRQDGQRRADHRTPDHPGVVVAFGSAHGPLKYATDTFTRWQANLRAIALGLEALRKVERYGITKRGEQYTGWKQLPSGIAMPATMTVEQAAQFLADHADPDGRIESLARTLAHGHMVDAVYRQAAKTLHPDHGGDTALFQKLQDAKRILDAHAGGAR